MRLALALGMLAGCTGVAHHTVDSPPDIGNAPTPGHLSRPPDSVVGPLATCPSAATHNVKRVTAPTDWRDITRLTLRDGDAVAIRTPAPFLPLTLAHMPDFTPSACIASTSRNGEWATVTVRFSRVTPLTIATNYGESVSWLGRPLIAVNGRPTG